MSFVGWKGTRVQAEALAARVDAALGWPRCGRLAGTVTQSAGRHASPLACPCVSVTAPHASCAFATRTNAAPVELVSGQWALPVDTAGRAGLTAGERSALATILPAEVKVTVPGGAR